MQVGLEKKNKKEVFRSIEKENSKHSNYAWSIDVLCVSSRFRKKSFNKKRLWVHFGMPKKPTGWSDGYFKQCALQNIMIIFPTLNGKKCNNGKQNNTRNYEILLSNIFHFLYHIFAKRKSCFFISSNSFHVPLLRVAILRTSISREQLAFCLPLADSRG